MSLPVFYVFQMNDVSLIFVHWTGVLLSKSGYPAQVRHWTISVINTTTWDNTVLVGRSSQYFEDFTSQTKLDWNLLYIYLYYWYLEWPFWLQFAVDQIICVYLCTCIIYNLWKQQRTGMAQIVWFTNTNHSYAYWRCIGSGKSSELSAS